MRFKIIIFLTSLLFTISCDSESIAATLSSQNPPRVNLVILNQDELSEKSIGDEVELQLALEVASMPNIKNIEFVIDYNIDLDAGSYTDEEYYSPANLDPSGTLVDVSSFQFTPNFFSLPQTSYPSPTGAILVEENRFVGNLGIPNPEINGNSFGAGRVCILYLQGVYTESLITLDIISASEYTDESIEAAPTPHWDDWIVSETIQVGSSFNPIVKLRVKEKTDTKVIVSIKIEDSPKLVEFSSLISYDTDVLSLITPYQPGDFFNTDYYDFSIEPDPSGVGLLRLTVAHQDPENSEFSMSLGTGDIFDFHFLIEDSLAVNTMMYLIPNELSVKGFSSSDSLVYDYNTLFWEIVPELPIQF